MLEDRPYMRRSSYGPRYSATILLLIVNVAAFFLQNLTSLGFANRYFALSVEGLRHGWLWQLVTFQFMHASLMHLLGNCFAIYMFGRPVEESLGRKNFTILYFASGIIGGMCQSLALLLTGSGVSVVGASAGAFGLTSAYAMLFPESIILLFFILPMRAKYLLLLCAALAVGGMVFPRTEFFGPNVAHAAHLGGMICGFIFVRYAVHWNFSWPSFVTGGLRKPSRPLVRVRSEKYAGWNKSAKAESSADDFVTENVDPILDKISAKGIQSLTDRERQILEAARKKMRKP
jgi:membrane associated rhomboid family serine protease